MVACRRFRHGVRQLLRILRFCDRAAPVPNSKDVIAAELPPPDPRVHRMEIDASPWGGGGVLVIDGRPVRCFSCTWVASDFEGMNVDIGASSSQTFFEILVLVLAVELWAIATRPAAILGDNVSALQEALSLRGKGAHESS